MNYETFCNNYIAQEIPFFINLANGKTMSVNNRIMFKEEFNLIVSKRDFKLFANGIKPHRHWKFNYTKEYFGLKGNKQNVAKQIEEMYLAYKEFYKHYVTYE
tara:strand:- start:3186 stop:3491 length:306 start_codon:yes stop_codon:yes gene_type:complete